VVIVFIVNEKIREIFQNSLVKKFSFKNPVGYILLKANYFINGKMGVKFVIAFERIKLNEM